MMKSKTNNLILRKLCLVPSSPSFARDTDKKLSHHMFTMLLDNRLLLAPIDQNIQVGRSDA